MENEFGEFLEKTLERQKVQREEGEEKNITAKDIDNVVYHFIDYGDSYVYGMSVEKTGRILEMLEAAGIVYLALGSSYDWEIKDFMIEKYKNKENRPSIGEYLLKRNELK